MACGARLALALLRGSETQDMDGTRHWQAGEQIDDAVEEAGERLEEATREAEDAIDPPGPAERAGRRIDEAMEEAADD
ncbi:hypothetical protein B1C78_12225 [Thioalkalivibrio denitrificans]|uniref:Uncharacterized protein n=2 Tax=Thioalkalivibrio denitrificans TaxID=108003 RepID=A0A1V3NDT5_9GAMM|nr:hypothetical protein B1C78_12225 [Thioalkalivibrio denitrificans]